MKDRIVMTAEDLDGYLREKDKEDIKKVEEMYSSCLEISKKAEIEEKDLDSLAMIQREIGHETERIVSEHERIHVYSFDTPDEMHAECSRIIARLRDPETDHEEFVYYIQRAYEMLFTHSYLASARKKKRKLVIATPVTDPANNYAVHFIPDCEDMIKDSVMCVMLRGAILPSMIISKEIESYSESGYITPFALFKIKRDESRNEDDMNYVLSLDRSYFRAEDLEGKNLIFADPMNATGGSLVTIIKYIKNMGIKPKSIKVLNVISALKGALRITRAVEDAEIYTLWMDPVLNEKAYILPGLGDAGDRLNGRDEEGKERNIIQLVADYGSSVVNLYRNQVREIEKTVLS